MRRPNDHSQWLRGLCQKAQEGLQSEETSCYGSSQPRAVKGSLPLGVGPALWSSSHTSNIIIHRGSFRDYNVSCIHLPKSDLRHQEHSVIGEECIIEGNWSSPKGARGTDVVSWAMTPIFASGPRLPTPLGLSTTNTKPWNQVALPCSRSTEGLDELTMETDIFLMQQFPKCLVFWIYFFLWDTYGVD